MRIIAGAYKSRILKDPVGHKTHPMSEKIRGALFNVLGDIEGCTVLDAYAGTGAVGIEALSRGAARIVAVEVDKDAYKVLKVNRDAICDEGLMEIHRANVSSWVLNQEKVLFDIVIADPPYDGVSKTQLVNCTRVVRPDGLFVASLPPEIVFEHENLLLLDERTYGDAKLVFYRKVKA